MTQDWGSFFAVDPFASEYLNNSPYAFSENVVIHSLELEGLEKWELSNGNTSAETFYGPFSNEYINSKQNKVDRYQGVREKTNSALLKVEYESSVGNVTPYPIEPSPVLIYDVPVVIKNHSGMAFAEVKESSIYIYGGLDKMTPDFQVAVFAHEYAAHYLEEIFDLIEDSPGVVIPTFEENPFHDPTLPDKGPNKKFLQGVSVSGPEDTAKEEVNGWSLMKYMNDEGIINLSAEENKRVNKTLKIYENKMETIQTIKAEDGKD
jgi:hypothetical protein